MSTMSTPGAVTTPNLRQGQRMISKRIQKKFGSRYYPGTIVRVWQAEAGSHGRIGKYIYYIQRVCIF